MDITPDYIQVKKLHKAKFSGPCKYHPRFFGEELIVERNAPGSTGYYACENCQRALRREREYEYVRKNGKPLRIRNTETVWDIKTKRFVSK